MINTVKLNARNLQLLKEIMSAANGRTNFTRTELRAFHKKLRGRTGSPYFITKNLQARPTVRDAVKLPRGTFIVDRFLKYAEKHPPEPMPAPKAKAKKEAKPKREAIAKKGASKVVKAEAEAEAYWQSQEADQNQDRTS